MNEPDQRQGKHPGRAVGAKRLSEFLFLARKIQAIIDDLKGNSESMAEPVQSTRFFGGSAREYTPAFEGTGQKNRCFFIHDFQIFLFGQTKIVFFLELVDFAVTDCPRGVKESGNDFFVTMGENGANRLVVEIIAHEHRHFRPPLDIDGGNVAAQISGINDVVMNESGCVKNLEGCRERHQAAFHFRLQAFDFRAQ